MSHATISVIEWVNRTAIPVPQLYFCLSLWVKMVFRSGILRKWPMAKGLQIEKMASVTFPKCKTPEVFSVFLSCQGGDLETQRCWSTEKAKSAAPSPGFKIRTKAGPWAAAAAGATGTAVRSARGCCLCRPWPPRCFSVILIREETWKQPGLLNLKFVLLPKYSSCSTVSQLFLQHTLL